MHQNNDERLSTKNTLHYFLCGLAMGAADTVPGISGGTIAFITGIYEKLLQSIQTFDKKMFLLLYKREWNTAIKKIPWGFLLPLGLGIVTAIFSLANVVVYLMETHIHVVWASFFGLVLSSLCLLAKNVFIIQGNGFISSFLFLVGTVLSIWIMFFQPIALPHTYPIIFFSGFIAICAMILPGISGAFILVLMGQYQFILEAVTDFNLLIIITFLLGTLCGLLSFTNIVHHCLKKYSKATLSFLSGILAGSLVSLFPFTHPIQINNENILLCLFIVVGFLIPLLLHKVNSKMTQSK